MARRRPHGKQVRERYASGAFRKIQPRARRAGPNGMTIEEFGTREERDGFYRDLKAMNIPNVSKMTEQRDGKIVWQVLRP